MGYAFWFATDSGKILKMNEETSSIGTHVCIILRIRNVNCLLLVASFPRKKHLGTWKETWWEENMYCMLSTCNVLHVYYAASLKSVKSFLIKAINFGKIF